MATATTIDVTKIATPVAEQAKNYGFKFLGTWYPNMGKRHSLAALIYLAMVADGFESIEEQEEVHALVDRTRTLGKLNKKASQAVLESVEKLVREKGHAFVREKACRVFRDKPAAESAFLHVADILLADRVFLDNEERMLGDVAFHLHLDAARAKELFEMMRIKNKY